MPKPQVVLIGDEDLIAKLNRLGTEVAERGLDEAVHAGAIVVQREAKARARSTTVAAAIEVRKVRSRAAGRVSYNVRVRHERGPIEEFGSGPRTGRRGPHSFPARPYLRPAADESHGRVQLAVSERLRAHLR